MTWNTFEEFVSIYTKIGKLKIDQENIKMSSCSCPMYKKKQICIHYIAYLIKRNIISTNFITDNIISPNSKGELNSTGKMMNHRPNQVGNALQFGNKVSLKKKGKTSRTNSKFNSHAKNSKILC